jgi:hypothetical protein
MSSIGRPPGLDSGRITQMVARCLAAGDQAGADVILSRLPARAATETRKEAARQVAAGRAWRRYVAEFHAMRAATAADRIRLDLTALIGVLADALGDTLGEEPPPPVAVVSLVSPAEAARNRAALDLAVAEIDGAGRRHLQRKAA